MVQTTPQPLARAIEDTVRRYWDGCMSRPTYRSHLRSLWGQVMALGLAEYVTEMLPAEILNALDWVRWGR